MGNTPTYHRAFAHFSFARDRLILKTIYTILVPGHSKIFFQTGRLCWRESESFWARRQRSRSRALRHGKQADL